MRALSSQIGLGLKLALRNRMGLIYGFLFPQIFLLAFWAIYRREAAPFALHVGELLTVTVLGGACFGLPTTLVSEREQGIWRRYQLTPASPAVLIGAALTSRTVLILAAALLQMILATLMGMPTPTHPYSLVLAVLLVTFAFLGLGLVVAMLADNVPAVQALGQCLFLPMLIIGGVAVRLTNLPEWALHISVFFPGRYAVAVLQACATGAGFAGRGFDMLALALIGLGAFAAGLAMFRWAPGQQNRRPRDRLWLALALGVWGLVGLMAEMRGRLAPYQPSLEYKAAPGDFVSRRSALSPAPTSPPPATPEAPATPLTPKTATPSPAPAAASATKAKPASGCDAPDDYVPPPEPATWQAVGQAQYDSICYDPLPDDAGVVTPVASPDVAPDPLLSDQLDKIAAKLEDWGPAKVSDPIQRARNILYVAAVTDKAQVDPMEKFLPLVVFDKLEATFTKAELPKILFWVAMHPDDGSDDVMGQLSPLDLPDLNGPDRKEARERAMIYALKLLGRLTGQIK
ncbi:MAG: hypothetical protein JWM33_1837 [Caulobacteraceae bacterium]|nr:hypothetical protein [Caulobacteraceae bacterium]